MITRLDADVGRLLDKLTRIWSSTDNTIVFFTSDNGPHKEGGDNPRFFNSAGGLRGIKRDLYEGGIRMPMIVRWPGHVQAAAVNDLQWAFWDFLPTCADLAEVKPPDGIDGISVLPILLGKGVQRVSPVPLLGVPRGSIQTGYADRRLEGCAVEAERPHRAI